VTVVEMHGVLRVLLAVVAALVIVGLLGYARGAEHHRGNEVGSSGDLGGLHGRVLT
jgi:hypothetical protein